MLGGAPAPSAPPPSSAAGMPLGGELAVFAVLSVAFLLVARPRRPPPPPGARPGQHRDPRAARRPRRGRGTVAAGDGHASGCTGALWSARPCTTTTSRPGPRSSSSRSRGDGRRHRRPTDPPQTGGGTMDVSVVVAVLAALVVILVITTLAKSVTVVRQAEAAVVERLGRYQRTAEPGLTLLVPFIDRIRERVDAVGAGRLVPAPARDHPGQPDGLDRHGRLLPGHRTAQRRLRDQRTTSTASSSSPPRRCATWSAG